ncbi:MAG: ribosome small subunit-dependent GTPase A [Clostridiales bacterium]|nr:ribosome small subunit-dependent GTPase A [Clostridiales bacterium]
MNITDYGFVPGSESGPGIPGRVTAVHKERYEVVCEYGETGARLKAGTYYGGSADFPTVGDFVMLRYVPDGDSLILSTLPRRTFFSRRDPDRGRGEQAVAANFDDVFLLQSLNEDFNLRRLERYLTLAWQSGATPVIVLTKADLAEDYSGYLAAVGQVAPGVAVHLVSTKTGFGLEALQSCFRPGRTAVFLGSSGVGKSSLVNALAGEEIMSVGLIRADDGKGRHTTTHRQLLRLPGGAIIIDTPGMRELGMWAVSEGLEEAFPDVERFLGRCRFRDCTHTAEPGCAIRAALEEGELSQVRWDSYRSLQGEAKYAEDRASLRRRKEQWSKGVAKSRKQRNRET